MNETVIRPLTLTLDDAAALLAVERVSLQDSQYTAAEALAVLHQPDHWAYVAGPKDACVGFLFCFLSPGPDGPQLELDMLGVAPEHRRRGLASRLVDYACQQAAQRGVTRARAIVERGNSASRCAFERAGLHVDQRAQFNVYEIGGNCPLDFVPSGWSWHKTQDGELTLAGLRLAARGPFGWLHWLTDGSQQIIAAAECLRVTTLSYRGLWIERLWGGDERSGRLLARAAVEQAKAEDLDEVGYLQVTPAKSSVWPGWEREGFVLIGEYDVMRRG